MRPNIVFAFADDWGRYASAYRDKPGESKLHELIETPNFDRIANEGTLFLNANVPAPSCTPCRSSILTGRYFWQTGMGAILQGARWDETIPTYPLILEKAGYHIGYSYKVWAPGISINAPYGGKRTQFEPAGYRFNQFSEEVTNRPAGQSIEDAKQELLDETEANFDSFLDARPNNNGTEEPFCYWWGPTNTHRTWQQGSGKELWNIDPDDLKGRMPEFLPDVHEIREDFADYLGECQAFDAGLGVIIAKLEERGELDNTLLVVSGDHGIPGFPRAKCNLYNLGTEVSMAVRWPDEVTAGRTVDDFVNLMDLAPTFLEAANVELPDKMTGKSLLPLLQSKTSGQVEPERTFVLTGKERHNIIDDAKAGEALPYPMRSLRNKDFLYIHNFEPDRWPAGEPAGLDDPTVTPPPAQELLDSYTIVYPDFDRGPTRNWMIFNRADPDVAPLFELGFGKRPQEELYDLRSDPDYMNNLASDPSYAQTRKQLHDQLMEILHEQNDPRVVESPPRFELPPYAGPNPEEWNQERIRQEALMHPE
jgi:arylsulfatase A-like enzyme